MSGIGRTEKSGFTIAAAVRCAEIPGYRLVYVLYRTKLKRGGSAYSVSVTISSGEETVGTTASDLTRSREKAEEIFRALADGSVTPCALTDVLEELL